MSTHWELQQQHVANKAMYPIGPNRDEQARAKADLVAAYDETPDAEVQRNISKAQSWRYNAHLEHLAELEESQPDAFAKLPPATKMSLGFYLVEGRAAAVAAGIDTDPPGR